ncbi:MAG TPA: hypothetical protein VNW92_09185, partial [Polyangiaceae bacterium]|nr:hypothetical protein [Polyangiaceae bacterium]
NELLVLAATQPARSLGTLRPELDKALVKVVDRALAFDRRERWPSARAMHSALAEAARVAGLFGKQPPAARSLHEAETAPEMSVPNSQPAPGSPRGRARLAWVLVALFAFALGGTALALRASGQRDWQVDSGAASVLPPGPKQLASPAAQPPSEASASPTTSVAPQVGSSLVPPPLSSASLERPSGGTRKAVPRATAPHAVARDAASTSAPSNPLFFPGK